MLGRLAAVQELALGWKDDPETLPILKQLAQSDDSWDVRYSALEELAFECKDEPGIFEGLADFAINYPFERKSSPNYNLIPDEQHLKSCSNNTQIAQKL